MRLLLRLKCKLSPPNYGFYFFQYLMLVEQIFGNNNSISASWLAMLVSKRIATIRRAPVQKTELTDPRDPIGL